MPQDDTFYNPYHFVPLEERPSADKGAAKRFRSCGPEGEHNHAAYAGLSGRIICRLVPEEPLSIGGKQEPREGEYTLVHPYKLDGQPAIPATSLKGMISSLLEGASASALRVLAETKPVSWRQPAGRGALSALGLLKRDNGELRLQPLTAPTLIYNNGQIQSGFQKWHELFEGKLPLKINLGDYIYRTKEKADASRTQPFRHKDFMESFDSSISLDDCPTLRADYYVRAVKDVEFDVSGRPATPEAVDTREIHTNRGRIAFALGLKRSYFFEPTNGRQAVRTTSAEGYIRGFVRVLGGEGRDMATPKKHEVFIPYPDCAEKRDSLRITKRAIASFQALANERTFSQNPNVQTPNSLLPYTPFEKGRARVKDRKTMRRNKKDYQVVELKPGQIVCFDIGKEGHEIVVTAVSFSSIWRDLVEKTPEEDADDAHIASMRDFFAAFDKELLPFNPKRETISPAEWLFGFVEEGRKTSDDPERPHNAYRGRLRFSAGRLADPPSDSESLFMQGNYHPDGEDGPRNGYVRLRELSSPKPPSPAMYFRPDANGRPVPKTGLKMHHRPQGRKMYLHKGHRVGGRTIGNGQHPWATSADARDDDGKDRKLAVRLLDPQQVEGAGGFWFHVDFDNLSDAELDLLCFGLSPCECFRHKLGLGKPLGLGTVRIEPMALCLIDRGARYRETDPLVARRYDEIWLAAGAPVQSALAVRYPREAEEATDGRVASNEPGCRERARRHAGYMGQNLPASKRALDLLGHRSALDHRIPVQQPLAHGQTDPEQETYKWFVDNDRRQVLAPIEATTTKLPRLKGGRARNLAGGAGDHPRQTPPHQRGRHRR